MKEKIPEKLDNICENGPKGLLVAGLSGGSGKSLVAVALAAAFSRRGYHVCPFKKGPDYIDAGWLQMAAGKSCYNLDPYLMDLEDLRHSFFRHARQADMVIVEGNRGLFDGVNVEGEFSSAELAVNLGLPVLLVVDCTKTTRTVAAMVLGCKMFDERVHISGIILNKLAGSRHEKIVRQSVEHYTGIPVLGAIRRSKEDVFPQRHLGVTPFQEHNSVEAALNTLVEISDKHIDMEGIARVMAPLQEIRFEDGPQINNISDSEQPVRIGVIRDAAFQFYYPENLESLSRQGARLLEINALEAKTLPELDALYIGGGFPETSARQLARNESFRRSVKKMAEQGLPIYAECGGLIYLGEKILIDGETYPLAGVFPVSFTMESKPQAHGYTILMTDNANPFYSTGAEIKGHEFRYSKIVEWQGKEADLAFQVKRGVGFSGKRDGLVYKNVLALYTHIHAIATPQWASLLVEKARSYRAGKS